MTAVGREKVVEKDKGTEGRVNEVFGIWEFLGIHEKAVVWGV